MLNLPGPRKIAPISSPAAQSPENAARATRRWSASDDRICRRRFHRFRWRFSEAEQQSMADGNDASMPRCIASPYCRARRYYDVEPVPICWRTRRRRPTRAGDHAAMLAHDRRSTPLTSRATVFDRRLVVDAATLFRCSTRYRCGTSLAGDDALTRAATFSSAVSTAPARYDCDASAGRPRTLRIPSTSVQASAAVVIARALVIVEGGRRSRPPGDRAGDRARQRTPYRLTFAVTP